MSSVLSKSKSDSNSQVNELVDGLAPSQIIDHKVEQDVSLLIMAISHDENLPNSDFVEGWLKLYEQPSRFIAESAVLDTLNSLIEQLIHYYRVKAPFSHTHEILYLSWSRVGSDIGNPKAMLNLVKYAIGHQLPKPFIDHWSTEAFEALGKTLDKQYRVEETDSTIVEMNKLIRYITQHDPELALSFTIKLMKYVRNDSRLKHHADELQNDIRNLSKGLPGVLVLESISPAQDKTVQAGCARFENLTIRPTKLVNIGDVSIIQKTLDAEFPWFSTLTQKFIEALLVRKLGKGDFFLPPHLLLGAAGIGKTSYVQRFCELIKIPSRVLSSAGKNDNRDLVGTSRGWGSGHPSMPISLINDSKVANPLVMLDELDKTGGSDANGRILDSLLTLFEPSSSARVFDEYLCGHCDLSHITWLATANDHKQLPNTLLSRLEVVTIAPPKQEHYPQIVRSSIQSFCTRNGIHEGHIPEITEVDWAWLRKYFSSPRIAKRATEKWLTHKLLIPSSPQFN